MKSLCVDDISKTFSEDPEKANSEIMCYVRTRAEFREMFQYGKVYKVKNVNPAGKKADMYRVYLLKDGTLKVMPTAKYFQVTGLPESFKLHEDDYIFYSTDGIPSILREGVGSLEGNS